MLRVNLTRLLLLASLAASSLAAITPAFEVHERLSSAPSTFTKIGAAPVDHILFMRINLAMGNRDGLEEALVSASTPGSPSFRQWLSKEQVEAYVKPSADATKAVTTWLNSNGIVDIAKNPAGDWLSFSIPVSKANTLLNTKYALYRHSASGAESIHTLEYSLPLHLTDLIRVVHPTTSFSGPMRAPPVVSLAASQVDTNVSDASPCNGKITPACLAKLYNIPTSTIKNSNSTIAVTAFEGENANFADLKSFLQKFRSDLDPNTSFDVTLIDGAVNSQVLGQAGYEANLDIQYTVGLVNGLPTSFVDVGEQTKDGKDEGFLDVINALNAESNPPLVVSTSYGFETEAYLSYPLTTALCDAYLQLTSRGVSITFASGDGGVASTPGVPCKNKPFPPTFPTCPYVTLVGATENVPEKGAELSAGGFSNYFPQPAWQSSAVNAYIKKLGSTYKGLYNASGRAYPDVSAQGEDVQVVVRGKQTSIGGTSASSPIFSSVIALINHELLAVGKPPLGFLNPWLYANPQAFNDVTTGNNPGCGTDGFSAAVGWDPVTGLGSPNYKALLESALKA